MATDVLECLMFTYDTPESNPEGQMPVLDTKMWLGMKQMTPGMPEAITQDRPNKPGEAKG